MNEIKCPYCQSIKNLLEDFNYADESYMEANILSIPHIGTVIYIEHMKEEKYGKSGHNAWFKINYCPFCGRPLGENK